MWDKDSISKSVVATTHNPHITIPICNGVVPMQKYAIILRNTFMKVTLPR
jgi:hypothetical protein